MRPTSWPRRLLLTSLALVLLSGCGVGPWTGPADPPPPLPADRVVFRLQGGGGMTPPFVQALATPALMVYGDGRVIAYAERKGFAEVPAAYVVSRVDPLAVAAFAADAEQRAVIDPATDFGRPQVSDMPSTSVALHGSGDPRTVRVYAFGGRFDDDLSWGQRRARKELAEIVDAAFALPGDGERAPLVPDQVRVIELESSSGDDGSTVPWPGPNPDGFLRPGDGPGTRRGCGTLSGSDAETAYAAARANPRGRWTVAGRPRVLAVAALLPGAEGCPP